MRKLALAILVAVASAGVIKAQQVTGETFETVKKDVLQLEDEQRQCLLSGSSCADWINKHYAEGALIVSDAAGTLRQGNKAQLLEDLKSGQVKVLANNQSAYLVHVYGSGGDGTAAVVGYNLDETIEIAGNRYNAKLFGCDIWHKQNGQWWNTMHSAQHRY